MGLEDEIFTERISEFRRFGVLSGPDREYGQQDWMQEGFVGGWAVERGADWRRNCLRSGGISVKVRRVGGCGRWRRTETRGIMSMGMGDVEDGMLEWDGFLAEFKSGVNVQDRKFRMRKYASCFVGFEAVEWLLEKGKASNEEDAIRLGNSMMDAGVFHHVLREHSFKNENLYYRFAEDEDHGGVALDKFGSWGDLVYPSFGEEKDLQPTIPKEIMEVSDEHLSVARAVRPLDNYNIELLDKVHPAGWQNPKPKGKYHLVVIGAGAGGLVSAAGAAGVGAKVALIEAHLLGGDCLNVGCVPSKTLIASAKAAWTMKDKARLAELGLDLDGEIKVDFAKVMERVRKIRAEISENDSATRFATVWTESV